MKILCNGFNLYGQLGKSEHLLESFTKSFEGYLVDELYINHSFSALKIQDSYKIVYKNCEKYSNTCGKIVKICSNDERVILLNSNGKLFKIELTDTDTSIPVPNMLGNNFPDEQITNVSCGSKITVAYTNKGNVYNMPHKLNFNKDITSLKCGREHCILLDKLGNVFTFGRGSRGQLGHGQLEDESEPVQVQALGGIKIVQVAAGGWHSCALSEQGDLYIWGWNGNGQLGLDAQGKDDESSISVMASPHVVDFPNSQNNAVQVACGSRHTIVLLDNMQLFGCGWNKYKQLKNVDNENFYSFIYLQDFSDEEVISLKCGPWNSAVICK